MMEMLAATAARINASLIGADVAFERVVTDTRQLRAGDLFVALKGERFDGHDFVQKAAAAGAAAALVSQHIPCALPQLLVPDVLQGLQAFAASWRKDFDLPVVAVTGSNGKTTTKQMLAAIFAARGPVLATVGNLNNHIGLPLTLLSLRKEHRTAVIEMGANHLGEIALLTRLTQPDVGLVTQAGDAHLEGFGSREGVARGKGELFAGMSVNGVAVINADDAYAGYWKQLAGQKSMLTFGFSTNADVQARQVEIHSGSCCFQLCTPVGMREVTLPLPGRHNISNALGAAACGVALGMEVEAIATGLGRAEGASGRVSWKTTAQGARLIDDSYNANPSSLRAGMELLATQPGERWLVLGGMAELGEGAAQMHHEAGAAARSLGIHRLFALGSLAAEAAKAFGTGATSYEDVDALAQALRGELNKNITLLVKGSRSARMERVVARLCEEPSRGDH